MHHDKVHGWGAVPPLDRWVCPVCTLSAHVDLWKNCTIPCDTCDEHDARQCPQCDTVFGIVWDDDTIAAVQPKPTSS